MAATATIHGKRHGHVAGTAIHSVEVFFLVKLFGTHFFDRKYIRVTVRAVQPLDVSYMGKVYVNPGFPRCPAHGSYQVLGQLH